MAVATSAHPMPLHSVDKSSGLAKKLAWMPSRPKTDSKAMSDKVAHVKDPKIAGAGCSIVGDVQA
jgi:hypothetical protein